MASLTYLTENQIIDRYFARLADNTGNGYVNRIAELFKVGTGTVNYPWLGQVPSMRAWGEGRSAKSLAQQRSQITNTHYEISIDISTEDLIRDNTGQILKRVDELADQSNNHWGELITALILAGDTTDCYDGLKYYAKADSPHTEGSSGTQVNYLTSTEVTSLDVTTATAPTASEMSAAVLDCIAYMLGYKDNQGNPVNNTARNWLVLTGAPKVWTSAVAGIKSTIINNTTNAIANSGLNIDVEYDSRLAAETSSFYLFRTDASVKPFIRQYETEPELRILGAGSEHEFNNHSWRVGVDSWRGVGYGYWVYSSQCVLSAS